MALQSVLPHKGVPKKCLLPPPMSVAKLAPVPKRQKSKARFVTTGHHAKALATVVAETANANATANAHGAKALSMVAATIAKAKAKAFSETSSIWNPSLSNEEWAREFKERLLPLLARLESRLD